MGPEPGLACVFFWRSGPVASVIQSPTLVMGKLPRPHGNEWAGVCPSRTSKTDGPFLTPDREAPVRRA